MFTHFLNLLATIISVASLLIVTYGALIAMIQFIVNEFKRFTGKYNTTNIRRLRTVFGTYLLLGLESLIASDILITVFEPTMTEMNILSILVIVSYTLFALFNLVIIELESYAKACT